MVDYKQLYLELFRGVERAIRELETTQQRCEELYLSSEEDEEPTDEEDEEPTDASTSSAADEGEGR